MDQYGQELLFFFSALGAFNGMFMGLYFLIFAKPRHISNRFLGAFIIALSIRIGKSVFFYFNSDLSYTYLQFGLVGCFFIGPFLYFYIKSMVKPERNIHKEWLYHIIVLIPVCLFICIGYPFGDFVDLWRWTIINSIYSVWLIYTLVAIFLLRDVVKNLFNKKAKSRSLSIWLVSIVFGNLAIWAAYTFAGLGSYILGALLFSFILYLMVLFLIFSKRKNPILFKDQEKYKDKKIASPHASLLLNQLESLMIQKELYKNSNLKLNDVAKQLNVLPHTLSQLLNDNVGKGFPQFLNEYRIEEAKKMLGINDNFTLESIGYDCGFNSKSTFYSTFKKMTGTTPAKFKEKSF